MPVPANLSYRSSMYRSPIMTSKISSSSSNYPSSSLSYRSSYDHHSFSSPTSTALSSNLRSLSSSSVLASSSLTSSSSYLSSHYRPSSLLFNSAGYSSTSPSSVQLTRFKQRRSSLDRNDDDFESLSSSKVPTHLSGLHNLGNTCYMNAILQSLYAADIFRNYVVKSRIGPLNSALGQLFEKMKDRSNISVNPSYFRSQFTRVQPRLRGYDQQDAQEFFQYLINALHDEINKGSKYGSSRAALRYPKSSAEAWEQYRSLEDSPYVDMMSGQLSSTVTCCVCGNTSTCWDPFWDLSLPLPTGVHETNSQKLLEEFTALEELSKDEFKVCERCKKPTRSTKKLSIEKAPAILILHLKRFSNDGYKLTIPRVIPNERLFAKSKYYSLCSIVLHHGNSIRSGHYTAYCQHDSKWYHFNDDRINEAKNFSPGDADDSYILFYVESAFSSRL